jgi:hypothetical protein
MKYSISPSLKAFSMLCFASLVLTSSCKKNLLSPEPQANTALPALKTSNGIIATNRYFIFPQGNSLPANAINSISQAGGTVYKNFNSKIGVVVATSTNPNFISNMQNVAGVRKVVQSVKVNLTETLASFINTPPSLQIQATLTGDTMLSGI